MANPTNRGKPGVATSKYPTPMPLLSAPPVSQNESTLTDGPFSADLITQFQSLGLKHASAARLLNAARVALGKALAGLDSHALAAAPVAEQVSMLLPRFDVAALARECRLARADVQSALALLVLAFVAESRHAHH